MCRSRRLTGFYQKKELAGLGPVFKPHNFTKTIFTVSVWNRNSGTFLLTTTDEIQVLLDDHIVKTQMMKNSPYIKPFESIIK